MKIDTEQERSACATSAMWFVELYNLAVELEAERKEFEATVLKTDHMSKFRKLNNVCAKISGYAKSASYILKDNDITITP